MASVDESSDFLQSESDAQVSSAVVADHILGDQPAANIKEDRLGFRPYVQAVASFLTDSSTKVPLTLSIEGQWGSGKSSFMLLLQERLMLMGKSKVISFNAWQYKVIIYLTGQP